MSGINHVQDQLPAYALGILTPEEARQVMEHLENCQTCRQELLTYQQVVDELPLAGVQRTPPSSIKSQLLERAVQRQPVLRGEGFVPDANHHPGVPSPSTRPTAAPARGSIWQSFQDSLRRSAPVWAVASLVLILALAALNVWTMQRSSQLTNQFRLVALAGTDNAPHARGVLVMNPAGIDGTLVVDGLQELDYKHQYQLWLIKDGKRTSGGVFSVWKNGYGSMEITAPDPLKSYDSFGITVEPAGGSPGPTGSRVLEASQK